MDAVFDAGWNETAYHDAVSIACRYNYVNRLMEAYGVKALPPERVAKIAEVHRTGGYAGLRKLLD